jgi:hypothetical protein
MADTPEISSWHRDRNSSDIETPSGPGQTHPCSPTVPALLTRPHRPNAPFNGSVSCGLPRFALRTAKGSRSPPTGNSTARTRLPTRVVPNPCQMPRALTLNWGRSRRTLCAQTQASGRSPPGPTHLPSWSCRFDPGHPLHTKSRRPRAQTRPAASLLPGPISARVRLACD